MRALSLALLLALAPLSFAQPVRERVQIRYSKKAELASFLVTLVPQLKCSVEADALILEGSDEAIEQGKDLIARLDLPLDAVVYYLDVFTLEREEINNFGAFWKSNQVGVAYGGCAFSSPRVHLNWFLGQNHATMLTSRRLTGSREKECGLQLTESQAAGDVVGLKMNFLVHPRTATRMDLTVDLQEQWSDWSRKLRTEVALSDGDSLLIRGLAADHAGQTLQDLGSIRELVDAAGAIQAEYRYSTYGEQTKVSGNLDSDWGYAGLWHHQASGLDLATYRAYDAANKRWISRDPLGEGVDTNLYRYCGNSPINHVDPSGLVYITDTTVELLTGANGFTGLFFLTQTGGQGQADVILRFWAQAEDQDGNYHDIDIYRAKDWAGNSGGRARPKPVTYIDFGTQCSGQTLSEILIFANKDLLDSQGRPYKSIVFRGDTVLLENGKAYVGKISTASFDIVVGPGPDTNLLLRLVNEGRGRIR